MMKPRCLLVNREEDGISLQEFLAAHLRISRKRAKTMLDRRDVFVNRRRVWMAHHALRARDRVEFAPSSGPGRYADHKLLFEDDHYIVANKRAGHLANGDDSTESRLRQQLDCPELRAVHRLDRDTSGCLLLARTREAFDVMCARFRDHEVRKTYHALVAGRVRQSPFAITAPIKGRRAVTHVRVLDAGPDASHLLVKIETGRTHQIRRHLADLGHPVLGDRTYASGRRGTARSIRIGRHMLHAYELGFRHPFTERAVRARAPLPGDFRGSLKAYRLT